MNAGLLAVLVLALLAPIPFATAGPLDDLARAAEKEGPVWWYEPSTADQAATIVGAFNQRHPRVKIEHTRMVGGVDTAARIIQESRASTRTADVAMMVADLAWELRQRDLVMAVDWQGLGVPKAVAADPYTVGTVASTWVIIYNTQQVKPEQAPKNWEDLLDPRWRGKLGSPSFSHPIAQLVKVWGPERTTAYMDRFASQHTVLHQSTSTLAQSVASGELSAALSIYHTALPALNKGAPIKVVTTEPTSTTTNYSLVLKGTKSPNAAKLFVAWLVSDEGAKVYEEATGRGNPALAQTKTAQMLARHQRAEFGPAESPEFARWVTRFNDVLKKGGHEAGK